MHIIHFNAPHHFKARFRHCIMCCFAELKLESLSAATCTVQPSMGLPQRTPLREKKFWAVMLELEDKKGSSKDDPDNYMTMN